jgi:hypothetical protein
MIQRFNYMHYTEFSVNGLYQDVQANRFVEKNF